MTEYCAPLTQCGGYCTPEDHCAPETQVTTALAGAKPWPSKSLHAAADEYRSRILDPEVRACLGD